MFAHALPSRLAAGFLALAVSTVAAYAQTGANRELDALAIKALADWKAPGCAIAVIENGKVTYLKGYGVKELGKAAPVTPKTVFAIGSTTKAFTTTALAMLVDDGVLSWDDPVRKYLPNFHLSDPNADALVTVRDLVSHRTGLSRNDILWVSTPWSRADLLESIGRVPLTKPFRSAWQYQNLMFLAAGEVAAAASHSSWESLVESRILAPLGMRSTSLSTLDVHAYPDSASPHSKRRGDVQLTAWRNLDSIAAAGSVNSNVEDLAGWLMFHMNDGVTVDGKRLVSARNLHETHLPQMAMRQEDWGRNTTDETNQMTYGLAWFMQDYRGHHVVSHGGAIDGFRASITFLPNEKIGVIVLANLGDDNMPEALRWSILDQLLDAKPRKDWNAYLIGLGAKAEEAAAAARESVRNSRQLGTKPSKDLGAYAGFYRHPAYGMLRVDGISGGLLQLAWGNLRIPLEHFHYDTFAAAGGQSQLVTFRLDAASNPPSVNFLGLDFQRTTPPYDAAKIASLITSRLKLQPGEQVVVRYDPAYMADLSAPIAAAVAKAGGVVSATLPYVSAKASASDRDLTAAKLQVALQKSTVYLWMPLEDAATVTDQESTLLLNWLKSGGARREIHFHWNGGSVLADGLPTGHFEKLDVLYAKALEIDYGKLGAAQIEASQLLASGTIRVRTPAGTDISFRAGARPFNRQDGDASPARMESAKVQVDREIELPAGVVRVAPMEETANGVIVVPEARFGPGASQRVRNLRLEFTNGKVTRLSATSNEALARAAILGDRNSGMDRFREFGLGLNPALQALPGSAVLPYFAYGAGMVRMSLGDNQELGGAVTGTGGRRWFFFADATVEVNTRILVDHGKLSR